MKKLLILFLLFSTLHLYSQCEDTNFDNFMYGTEITTQISDVTVSAQNNDGPDIAMIFDSHDPTGGDEDLGVGIGNLLIISEDGDSDDPDDSAAGGVIFWEFEYAVDIEDIPFVDIEGTNTYVITRDINGTIILNQNIDPTGNGNYENVILYIEGAYYMEIHMEGSGAIGDFEFCRSSTVPLELTSFTAHTEGFVHVLEWTALSVRDVSHFEIEVSSDGYNFRKIGNISIEGVYIFTHLPVYGLNYYRLKIMDTDERFVYSDVITEFGNPLNIQKVYTINGRLVQYSEYLPSGIYFTKYEGKIYKIFK